MGPTQHYPWGQTRHRIAAAIVSAGLLILGACGLSDASALPNPEPAETGTPASPATSIGSESVVPDTSLATPDLSDDDAGRDEAGKTVTDVVDSLLVAMGESGYYGECPTVESTGLDPLSLEANSALVEMTKTDHCSWLVESNADDMTISLDRLDVFGDENIYFVALSRTGSNWALTSAADRPALATVAGPNSVWLDDLLPVT